MKRGSFVTPLLLILIGVVFLLKNINPELRVFQMVFDWWPFLLIGWGALRIVEILATYFRGGALPVAGVSGGEWAMIVILTIIGSSVWGVQRLGNTDRWFRMGDVEFFQQTYDYAMDPAARPANPAPRIVIENLRGSVRVIGADTNEVRLTGRKTIRASGRRDADTADERSQLDFKSTGDIVTIRTGQERASGSARVRSSIELTVPRGASIEARGRDLDIDAADLDGSIDLNCDKAGVRLQNIGGKIRADLRGSDTIRGFDLRGDVELKGRGRDIELENVTGQVTISGSYSGETTLRRVSKPVRFDSSVTNVRFETLPGEMRLTLNRLLVENAAGPLDVRTRNKDVELAGIEGPITVRTERGDVAVRQTTPLKAPLTVEVSSGNIDLALPPTATFQIRAETARGAVVNDFSLALKEEETERGAALSGALGTGPEIRLKTGRGEVSLRKITPIEAAPAPKAPKMQKAPAPAPEPPPVTAPTVEKF